MRLLPPPETIEASPDRFSGQVWVETLAAGEPPSRLRLGHVRFAPGARTAWHRHAVGQTLHVTAGYGVVQNRDGQTILLRAGETVHTPPGEWHWHGALPAHSVSHLALSETTGDPATADVDWAEHVPEEEYAHALAQLETTGSKKADDV